MNFDRYAGIAAAVGLLVIWTLVFLQPGEAIGTVVNVGGWLVTIGVGYWAWYGASRQIQLGQNQIELAQSQIATAREEIRKARYAALDAEVKKFGANIDRLKLAVGYLSTFAGRFQASRLDGWAQALLFARKDAADFLSFSAVTAPFGYGEVISTVIGRVQRLGEMIDKAGDNNTMPSQQILMYYDPLVREAITGILMIIDQIKAQIPVREQEMTRLADERDSFK